MSIESNKILAREFIVALNHKDLSKVEVMLASDFCQHSPGVPPSREAFFLFLQASYQAFPNGRFEIDDIIAEGQKVLIRWTFYGKHTGTWFRRTEPPTQKDICFTGMDLWRYDHNGKLAEAWFIGDMLGLMKQLGRIPIQI